MISHGHRSHIAAATKGVTRFFPVQLPVTPRPLVKFMLAYSAAAATSGPHVSCREKIPAM